MTREDIIRMARQVWCAGEVYVGPSERSLEQFAALVSAAAKAEEREACAKVADKFHIPMCDTASDAIAAAIRAGGQA